MALLLHHLNELVEKIHEILRAGGRLQVELDAGDPVRLVFKSQHISFGDQDMRGGEAGSLDG